MNKSWWWLAGFIVVGILIGAGILLLVTRPPRGEPVVLFPPPSPSPITVFVSGEVNLPGLYHLPADSRVNDAIQAAGGFTQKANTSGINLARILLDGEQVNVPVNTSLTSDGEGNPPTNPLLVLVDINQATVEELETLPEIGDITAQAIVAYRENNGSFTKIEDIMDVPGIGQGIFEAIKNLITVGVIIP